MPWGTTSPKPKSEQYSTSAIGDDPDPENWKWTTLLLVNKELHGEVASVVYRRIEMRIILTTDTTFNLGHSITLASLDDPSLRYLQHVGAFNEITHCNRGDGPRMPPPPPIHLLQLSLLGSMKKNARYFTGQHLNSGHQNGGSQSAPPTPPAALPSSATAPGATPFPQPAPLGQQFTPWLTPMEADKVVQRDRAMRYGAAAAGFDPAEFSRDHRTLIARAMCLAPSAGRLRTVQIFVPAADGAAQGGWAWPVGEKARRGVAKVSVVVAVQVRRFLWWDGEANRRGFAADVERLAAAADDVVARLNAAGLRCEMTVDMVFRTMDVQMEWEAATKLMLPFERYKGVMFPEFQRLAWFNPRSNGGKRDLVVDGILQGASGDPHVLEFSEKLKLWKKKRRGDDPASQNPSRHEQAGAESK